MFARKQPQKAVAIRREPQKPVAVRREPLGTLVELSAYREILDKVGFMPGQYHEAQLFHFLARENIPVFDLKEVDAYLLAEVKRLGHAGWGWRPLRDKDVMDDGWGKIGYKGNGTNWQDESGDWYSPSFVNCFPYQKLVPAHALRKVALLEEAVGDETYHFFVSDLISQYVQYPHSGPNSVTGDPFLMVTGRGMERHVIDVWDEPGFGV
jgi:hypothetical protein